LGPFFAFLASQPEREDIKKIMRKWILGSGIVALAVAGCGGGSGNSGTAFVMGVNALPNVGAVSITANGTLILSNASFGQPSSAFVAVNAGTAAPIFLTNSSSTQLASGTTTFGSGLYYSAFALGNTANQFVFIYPVDVTGPTTSGDGNLIFVNASVLQPAVDVYVTPVGGVQGPPQLTSMTPFNSGQQLANLPAGTYDVQFKTAGTATVLVDQPSITVGSDPTTNEIQIVGISDNTTGSATAQTNTPVIPVPVVAAAARPRNIGHAIVVGHPEMTSFPKGH
jgi:hypothetical protein